MILTTHSIVGASIANLFPNHPGLGFALSFASHYLLDTITHKDYNISGFVDKDSKTIKSLFNNMKSAIHLMFVGADFLVGVILCVLIFVRDEKTAYLTALGVLGGVLPDIFQFLYMKYKKHPFKAFQKIHDEVHNRETPVTGYLSQILSILFFVSMYFLFK